MPLDPVMLFIDLTEADEDLAAQEAYLAALTQDPVKADPNSEEAARSLLKEQRNRAVSPFFRKHDCTDSNADAHAHLACL